MAENGGKILTDLTAGKIFRVVQRLIESGARIIKFPTMFADSIKNSDGTDGPSFPLGLYVSLIKEAITNQGIVHAHPIKMTGSGKVHKEMVLAASVVGTGPAVNKPTQTLIPVGASGDVQEVVLSFSQTNLQEIFLGEHYPSDLDPTVDITISLMWKPGASWTTGNYKWVLEYIVQDENGDIRIGTPTQAIIDVTPANAYTTREDNFATDITLARDQVLQMRIYRDAPNDTANDVGLLRFLELEYTADRIGET